MHAHKQTIDTDWHTLIIYKFLWHSVVITVAHGVQGEYYQATGRAIGAIPEDSSTVSRVCLSVYVFLYVCLCGGGGVGGGGGVMPTLVYINKLQAQVRYTYITCRYLWINHAERLIVGDALTALNAGKSSAFLGEDITHIPFLPGFSPPAYNLLPGPTGNRCPKQAKNQVSSCVTLLIPLPLPPQRVDLDVQGGHLYKQRTFDLCVQSLTHILAHEHEVHPLKSRHRIYNNKSRTLL